MEFLKVKEEHLEQILKWRTSEHVTKYMFTDIAYNLDNQKLWFESISRDATNKYWVIAIKGQLIGLVSLTNIDWNNFRAYWAYYIGDTQFNIVGAMIGPYLYNYVFQKLGFHKLLGEVMAHNENVRKIHLKHGCTEVGHYRDHIYKNGSFHDVYMYEMLADEWNRNGDKFKRYIGSFEE
ncbi:UDP-4-amino-4,6-dideoxy-N-acetyl-beta-L-altrosamine N-acetyltransferase [Paenibacillus qinlingensis]|uniref:UDP-4-amino-4, 6-dideoxy-N-acetyl-beta-L-altrosamine N-acetyltransferase n=1 Tax=Paenibacillus qinlingensis TaxID=1837343 RepID=A0ABU1P1G7_9BACL|nr:UDP-4-amino-4,6-dideoxy-N-acetyl-beta-L-altrosamine N-acetyltransferase [Paenibacillus qinlingensis]MDR6553580.1 UDP-4-amino-4,6-dideoxy-N-acetyl-beta-L-altrosamine N-acetyltransferase [Paenibacillus qinlingensis]